MFHASEAKYCLRTSVVYRISQVGSVALSNCVNIRVHLTLLPDAVAFSFLPGHVERNEREKQRMRRVWIYPRRARTCCLETKRKEKSLIIYHVITWSS